ncbi:MAG: 1-acyl-sn-glycerol-3-phosphate acyltransferase [Pseudomonadales bacterium]|nr:1-acyl-sn-glycerol-3-phosphate acyltransferase [Pseudomonadales bacterium]
MNEMVLTEQLEFEDIRPFHDDEVALVIKQLLADGEFLTFLGQYHSPRLSRIFPAFSRFFAARLLNRSLGQIDTVNGFQQIISGYVAQLVDRTITQFDFFGQDQLGDDKAYLFVGNHRDIAGDSMLLNYALWLSERDTVRIAVGDNLVQRKFATALMKLNKSFFIKRSAVGAKKIYAALLQSSRYIHHSIAAGQSVWIAQSEGRAKNGVDITDPAIVKMLTLVKRKQALGQTVAELNIVPVCITYEFDPCDYLKAKELHTVATEGRYIKPDGEDLLSLVKGLGEFKGRVCLRFGEPLDGEFHNANEVANMIDRQIMDNLQLYYINYWALRELAESAVEEKYVQAWEALKQDVVFPDTQSFEDRLQGCPVDWRGQWLAMYANPVVTKFSNKSRRLQPI